MDKRLYRSRTNRVWAGVAGGLGTYFNVDPTVIRLIFVVLGLLAFGSGIILYLILWIIIPEESQVYASGSQPSAGATSARATSGGWIVGVALIAMGALFLLRNFVPWFSFGSLWPLLLIVLGLALLFGRNRREP